MTERQQAQDYFGTVLRTVVGQAFAAAGFRSTSAPLQTAGGRFRFERTFDDDSSGWIDFQVLIYCDTMWSGGAPSRFSVQLTRKFASSGKAPSAGPVSRSLSRLVVEDFGVNILPAADHWWTFRDTETLGKALAEAGHLIVGYGIPWLAGELQPPHEKADDLA